MAASAFLIALVATIVATGLSFLSTKVSSSSTSYYRTSEVSSSLKSDRRTAAEISVGAGVVAFILLFFTDWYIFYVYTPVFQSGGYVGLVLVNLIILLVVFGIADALASRVSASSFMSVLVLIIVCVTIVYQSTTPHHQSSATTLANLVHVTPQPLGAYPDTDPNHIRIVSQNAAFGKANSGLSGQAGQQNITTFFSIDSNGAIQLVDSHLYWIFPLHLTGTANQRSVKGVVPGYVAVDAEDPNADPKVHAEFKMKYTAGAAHGHSLTRLIYKSYPDWFIDDVTLEVNDQWQPFYTAALSRSVMGFRQAVPQAMIVVDPQTGKITRYPLSQIPSWVDRVYSQSTVTTMLNWWGTWGAGPAKAPFGHGKGSGNRFKVAGDPILVYTQEGPAWQALMTSAQKDTAVNYIALFSTTSNNVRLYSPNGAMTIESTALDNFRTSPNNKTGLEPEDLTLHKIYGALTWVTSYGAPAKASIESTSQSFHALGLMQVTDTSGATVIIGTGKSAKADALDAYQAQLAQGDLNGSPQQNARQSTVTGVVQRVNPQVVIGGQSYVFFFLQGDPQDTYKGAITDQNANFAYVQAGDHVSITYLNSAGTIRNMSSLVDSTNTP